MGRGRVDWAELRQRLERAGPAAADAPGADAERRRILDERARALARPGVAPPANGRLLLVSLSLAGETWGIDANLVWDAFRLVEFAPLPGATPPVAGITAWRGSVLTLLDLRSVLGIPAAARADLAYGVVVGERQPAFAVLADGLGELTAVDPRDVREPADGVALKREYVQGVTPETIFVLDLSHMLRQYR